MLPAIVEFSRGANLLTLAPLLHPASPAAELLVSLPLYIERGHMFNACIQHFSGRLPLSERSISLLGCTPVILTLCNELAPKKYAPGIEKAIWRLHLLGQVFEIVMLVSPFFHPNTSKNPTLLMKSLARIGGISFLWFVIFTRPTPHTIRDGILMDFVFPLTMFSTFIPDLSPIQEAGRTFKLTDNIKFALIFLKLAVLFSPILGKDPRWLFLSVYERNKIPIEEGVDSTHEKLPKDIVNSIYENLPEDIKEDCATLEGNSPIYMVEKIIFEFTFGSAKDQDLRHFPSKVQQTIKELRKEQCSKELKTYYASYENYMQGIEKDAQRNAIVALTMETFQNDHRNFWKPLWPKDE